MIELSIYTTLGCHLCAQLEALVATLANQEVRLHHIEISDAQNLQTLCEARLSKKHGTEFTRPDQTNPDRISSLRT